MAITRERKTELVDEYIEKLGKSKAVIVTEYRGLTVKQIEGLRRDLRNHDGEMAVSKNTLMLRALEQVGMPAPESLFKGPVSVTFCYGDLAAPAKTLAKWAKDTKILAPRGGIIGQSVFDATGVQALTELPGREQLLAQVVGTLQAPLAGLVNVLSGPMRGFVTVLNARAQKLEEVAA